MHGKGTCRIVTKLVTSKLNVGFEVLEDESEHSPSQGLQSRPSRVGVWTIALMGARLVGSRLE